MAVLWHIYKYINTSILLTTGLEAIADCSVSVADSALYTLRCQCQGLLATGGGGGGEKHLQEVL
jgi:hypothetical protein